MTNARGIADELGKKCPRNHSHVYLLNGRAKRAEVYPEELSRQILIGLTEQMMLDGRLGSKDGKMTMALGIGARDKIDEGDDQFSVAISI